MPAACYGAVAGSIAVGASTAVRPSAMLPRMAGDAPLSRAGVMNGRDLDEESRRWLERLRSDDPERTDAIEALHQLLHRAARHEANRRRGSVPEAVVGELDDLARQAAGDALTAILRKLPEYRGASRFTTWAYKFAVFEVSTAIRREAWRGRSITIDDGAWSRLIDPASVAPHAETEVRELLAAVAQALASNLSPRQREVFTAIVILEVPADVVAERHESTRGAIYKVLHDARRKIRASLTEQGWQLDQPGGR